MDINALLYPAISLGGMGILFGLGLGIAGVIFKVETDPKLPLVRDALPGANCGACGYAGCDAFADAVVKGEAPVGGCPVGGASSMEKIAEVMGVSAEKAVKKAAYVKCAGSCDKAKDQYTYSGMGNCNAAIQLAGGGSKACAFGCVGGGSCASVCMFDAIRMENGIAVIDKEKCTSCEKCIAVCPRNLIEIVPVESRVRVACNSKDTGKVVRGVCQVGCIACKMCEKECKEDAIHVVDNIAIIDYEKCTSCGACARKCPTKAIEM